MSQNNKDFDELNNLNITDDSLGLSDEMINAYMEANALETPDLWARIESGFEKEIQSLREDATVTISDASLYPPEQLVQQQTQVQQMPQSVQQAQVQQMQQPVQQTQVQQMQQPAQQSNVIDFQKRAARKKMLRNLAAVVILCVIAVPVMYMVSKNGNDKKSDEKYLVSADATTAAAAESAADGGSNHMNIKEDESPAATGDYDSEVQTDNNQAAFDTESGAESEHMELRIDVTGTFVYENDQLLFTIEDTTDEIYGSIKGGTTIKLVDSEESAKTYFEKVDGTDHYGPYSVSIDIDTSTVDEEQPVGVLLPNSSIKK